MRGRARVLARMAVRGRIAAQGDSARLTRSQVNPGRLDFHALLALARLRMLDVLNGGEVRTVRRHDQQYNTVRIAAIGLVEMTERERAPLASEQEPDLLELRGGRVVRAGAYDLRAEEQLPRRDRLDGNG